MQPLHIILLVAGYFGVLLLISYFTGREDSNEVFFKASKQSPWYVVNADDKRKARLNCIHHLLSKIPYQPLQYDDIELPPLPEDVSYVRPPMDYQEFVPEIY